MDALVDSLLLLALLKRDRIACHASSYFSDFMFLKLILFFSIFTSLSVKADEAVIYKIHNHKDEKSLLSVEAKFIGTSKTKTDLYIPFLSGIENISAKSNDVQLNVIKKDDIVCLRYAPFFCKVFSIQHNPNSPIDLEYSAGNSFGFYKDNKNIIFEANKALVFPILTGDKAIEFKLDSTSLNMLNSKMVSSKHFKNLDDYFKISMDDFYSNIFLLTISETA